MRRDLRAQAISRLCGGILALGLVCAGCTSGPPRQLPGRTQKQASTILAAVDSELDAVQCLSQYARAELGPEDIARLLDEGLRSCFPDDYERLREQSESVDGLSLGVDARNGKLLVLHANPLPLVTYADIPRQECCAFGGVPGTGTGCFGSSYLGCMPPETLKPIARRLDPGAFLLPVTRSPCRPGELLLPSGVAMRDPDASCRHLRTRNEDGLDVECKPRFFRIVPRSR